MLVSLHFISMLIKQIYDLLTSQNFLYTKYAFQHAFNCNGIVYRARRNEGEGTKRTTPSFRGCSFITTHLLAPWWCYITLRVQSLNWSGNEVTSAMAFSLLSGCNRYISCAPMKCVGVVRYHDYIHPVTLCY